MSSFTLTWAIREQLPKKNVTVLQTTQLYFFCVLSFKCYPISGIFMIKKKKKKTKQYMVLTANMQVAPKYVAHRSQFKH